MILLSILIALSVIFIVTLIYGLFQKEEGPTIVGIFGAFFVVIFGWGLCGTTLSQTEKRVTLKSSQYEINQTKHYTEFWVSDKFNTRLNDIDSFKHPEQKTVQLVTTYNLYGGEIGTTIEVK